jgi:hypothetical protein
MFIKYKIWKYKLAGVLPNENNILRDVRYWIENLCAYKKMANDACTCATTLGRLRESLICIP